MVKSVRKFLLTLVLLFVASVALIIPFWVLDFDSLEGYGRKEKSEVRWAFMYGGKLDGIKDYLIVQHFDEIRNRPNNFVTAKYWLKSGGYFHIKLNRKSINGGQCISPISVNGWAMKCFSPIQDEFFVCADSFFKSAKNIDETVSTQFYADKFEEISGFYHSLPDNRQSAKRYFAENFPRPIQQEFDGVKNPYYGDYIDCWRKKVEMDIVKPSVVNCEKPKFNKCEASSSIEILR